MALAVYTEIRSVLQSRPPHFVADSDHLGDRFMIQPVVGLLNFLTDAEIFGASYY
jgi:hypothetical protein